MSGAFRKKEVPFSQVSNKALRDERLSLKAKGLYSIIQMYITIPDFILYKTTLIKLSKDKKDSFNSAWKELKDAGYLIQHKMSNGEGKFCYEYDLLDETTTDGFSIHGLSIHGKTGIYNNKDLSNKDLNNKESIGNFGKQNPTYIYNSIHFAHNVKMIAEEVDRYFTYYARLTGRDEVYTTDTWIKMIDNLTGWLCGMNYDDIEDIIKKYLATNFESHSLYHSTLENVLVHRMQEVGLISHAE